MSKIFPPMSIGLTTTTSSAVLLGSVAVSPQLSDALRGSHWCARPGRQGGEPARGGPAHVVHPAELFEHPDRPGRDVDLSTMDTVARAGGVGVVQVVPGLTHGQDGQRPEVRAAVP